MLMHNIAIRDEQMQGLNTIGTILDHVWPVHLSILIFGMSLIT